MPTRWARSMIPSDTILFPLGHQSSLDVTITHVDITTKTVDELERINVSANASPFGDQRSRFLFVDPERILGILFIALCTFITRSHPLTTPSLSGTNSALLSWRMPLDLRHWLQEDCKTINASPNASPLRWRMSTRSLIRTVCVTSLF